MRRSERAALTLVLVTAAAGPLRAQDASSHPVSPMLAAAVARYHENRLEAAESLLESVVQLEPENDEAMLWLAETMLRQQVPASAAALARQVLRRQPCSSWAHTVLATATNPQYGEWGRASIETAWTQLVAAVRCDSTDGNAWLEMVLVAANRHDNDAYHSALRHLVTTGFLAAPTLAYNRWLLRQLPDSAMLITNGDLDTYPPLALQAAEGIRPDVTVINVQLLNLTWFLHQLRDVEHVPFLGRDSALDRYQPFRDSLRAYYLSDVVLMLWRRAEMSGTLSRRLVFAATVGDAAAIGTMRPGSPAPNEGTFALAGGYYVPVHGADTATVDTARLRVNLANANGRAFGGRPASPRDRSPVRSSQPDGSWANIVEYGWIQYISKLGTAGRSADARAALRDLEAFMESASLRDEASRRNLEQMRAWVAQLR